MITKENEELREFLYRKQIKMWQIGAVLGVSEMSVCRMFQKPLTEGGRERITQAVEQILKERGQVYYANAELRAQMRMKGISIRQLADAVGIRKSAMKRWLHRPFTDERRQRVKAAWEALEKEREG